MARWCFIRVAAVIVTVVVAVFHVLSQNDILTADRGAVISSSSTPIHRRGQSQYLASTGRKSREMQSDSVSWATVVVSQQSKNQRYFPTISYGHSSNSSYTALGVPSRDDHHGELCGKFEGEPFTFASAAHGPNGYKLRTPGMLKNGTWHLRAFQPQQDIVAALHRRDAVRQRQLGDSRSEAPADGANGTVGSISSQAVVAVDPDRAWKQSCMRHIEPINKQYFYKGYQERQLRKVRKMRYHCRLENGGGEKEGINLNGWAGSRTKVRRDSQRAVLVDIGSNAYFSGPRFLMEWYGYVEGNLTPDRLAAFLSSSSVTSARYRRKVFDRVLAFDPSDFGSTYANQSDVVFRRAAICAEDGVLTFVNADSATARHQQTSKEGHVRFDYCSPRDPTPPQSLHPQQQQQMPKNNREDYTNNRKGGGRQIADERSRSGGISVQCLSICRVLYESVTPSDYVVLKLDVEGGEWMLLEAITACGAWHLIDEMMFECHHEGMSPTLFRGVLFGQCSSSFKYLRGALNVLAHEWV